MKFAVIATGGKQYKVVEGKAYKFEKIDEQEGSSITFDEVLLYSDSNKTAVGAPTVKNANVSGKILEQGRSKKVSVIKYKRKTRYRRNKGHRQDFSKVRIEKITAGE